MQRLRAFHGQCVRAMCRVTRTHTWRHHITSEELRERLSLDCIDYYVARRQLRWLGHVSRMNFERLPRRMLSSWVPHKRPVGAPRFTMAKAMDVFRLDHVRWPELAANRGAWRAMLAAERRGATRIPAGRRPRRCQCRFRTTWCGRGVLRLLPPTAPLARSCECTTTTTRAAARCSSPLFYPHFLPFPLKWSRDPCRHSCEIECVCAGHVLGATSVVILACLLACLLACVW